MAATYLEFKDSKSSKFWEISVSGSTVKVRYGRIGTDGQTAVKRFKTAVEAQAHAKKVTAEKLGKGYRAPSRRSKPQPKLSVTHQVDQRMEIDLSSLAKDDVESAIELHKDLDICVADASFPGEMSWRVVASSAKRPAGRKGVLLLERTIQFTFAWSNTRAMSAWTRRNVSTDDALLPSHVAGDYEGIFVADQVLDYETSYKGECT